MELQQIVSEDKKLQAIIEYYLREYFKTRREAVRAVYATNPAIVNKEYSLSQFDAEVNELVAEVSEKVNQSLLLVLDLYTMGYRREAREFESAFVDLLNSKVLSKLQEVVNNQLTGVVRLF